MKPIDASEEIIKFTPGAHQAYRADIDGLRAIAVLSVVAFHAFPSAVKGGFVGVDIFFVISGFLISSILFRSFMDGTFTLGNFYARRIKRIFPALILVLAASCLIGWWVLLADEYSQLGTHVMGGAFFVSNLVLLKEAGYFDVASDLKPLLHLWSLGVEEQFYVCWPVLLWATFRFRLHPLLVTGLALAASFAVNVFGAQDPTAMFYSPATRFWELGLGSVLAYYSITEAASTRPTTRLSRLLLQTSTSNFQEFKAALGLLMVLVAVFSLSKSTPFPGWWALLPTGGAMLLISAGPDTWINRQLLANRTMVWIGLISFPLYLWHWPLLSFLRIVEGDDARTPHKLAAVLLSLVLAWLTWRWWERNLRFRKSGLVVSALLGAMLLLALLGYSIAFKNGYAFRSVNQTPFGSADSSAYTRRKSECFDIPQAHSRAGNWFCHLGQGRITAFVTGDSHALSILPAFEKIASEDGFDILFTGFSGCPPLLDIEARRGDQDERNCKLLNERILDYMAHAGIKDIFLVARWAYYTDGRYDGQNYSLIATDAGQPYTLESSRQAFQIGLRQTVKRYNELGIRVHILPDVPLQLKGGKDLPRKVALGLMSSVEAIEKFSVRRQMHQALQSFVNAEFGKQKADVIDMDKVYCGKDLCPFAAPDHMYYIDSDHLNSAGALLAVPSLRQRFARDY